MRAAVLHAIGEPSAHLDPDLEAFSLMAMSAGLATSVLAGQSSVGQAQAVIDYQLDHLFPASRPALRRGSMNIVGTARRYRTIETRSASAPSTRRSGVRGTLSTIGLAHDEAELDAEGRSPPAVAGGQVENQLSEAHRLEHDGPYGSVSAATYPQSTCRAIDLGA
jgi:hypothetical protein